MLRCYAVNKVDCTNAVKLSCSFLYRSAQMLKRDGGRLGQPRVRRLCVPRETPRQSDREENV